MELALSRSRFCRCTASLCFLDAARCSACTRSFSALSSFKDWRCFDFPGPPDRAVARSICSAFRLPLRPVVVASASDSTTTVAAAAAGGAGGPSDAVAGWLVGTSESESSPGVFAILAVNTTRLRQRRKGRSLCKSNQRSTNAGKYSCGRKIHIPIEKLALCLIPIFARHRLSGKTIRSEFANGTSPLQTNLKAKEATGSP